MVDYHGVSGRSPGDVADTEVLKAIRGASYPVDKEGLFEVARRNGAPGGVLDALHLLPQGRRYGSFNEVTRELDRARGEPHVP